MLVVSMDLKAEQRRPRWLQQRRMLAVVTGAAIGMAALSGSAWWWRTSMDVLSAAGGASITLEPRPVGSTVWFDPLQGENPAATIELRDASPRVLRAPQGSRVTVMLCQLPADGMGVGTRLEPPREWCDRQSVVPGATWSSDDDGARQALVVAVTRTQPGEVVIDGIDIRYSAGWRRGSEHAGIDMIMKP